MSSAAGKKALDEQATEKKVLDAGKKVSDAEVSDEEVWDEESLDAGKKVLDEKVSEEEVSDEEVWDEDSGPVVIIDLRDHQKQKANEKEARPTATMLSDPENITKGLDELQQRPFIMVLPAPSVAESLRKILLTEEDAAEEDADEGEAAEDAAAEEDAVEEEAAEEEAAEDAAAEEDAAPSKDAAPSDDLKE